MGYLNFLHYSTLVRAVVILKGLITSAIFLPLFLWSGFSGYESLSLTFFIFYFFYFLENFGKKINILDGVAFIAIIQYLLMSVLTYRLFDENSELAKIGIGVNRHKRLP